MYVHVLGEDVNFDKEVEAIEYRTQRGRHVQVFGAEATSEGIPLCGSQKGVRVLTERIPLVLSECRQLSFPEANIILYNACHGFEDLCGKFGPIEIRDTMIGFCPQGSTKVWINDNFGFNHAIMYKEATGSDFTDIDRKIDEKQMVGDLLGIVEHKYNKGLFPEGFRMKMYCAKSFEGCRKLLETSGLVPIELLRKNYVNLEGEPLELNQSPPPPPPPPKMLQSSPVKNNSKIMFTYSSPSTQK